MKNKFFGLFIALLILVLPVNAVSTHGNDSEIKWSRVWSEDVLKKAKEENKFVILDLEAVWCHWCHVMHETTYQDEGIVRLIKSKFIPIRIDHDLRPDLANKYREYGWPATIIFNGDGEEIAKRAGYIPADRFKLLLEKIIQDPTPEEPRLDESEITFSSSPRLSDALRSELINSHREAFDNEVGGLNIFQKYIDRDTVEYNLINASNGNKNEERMVKLTLDNSIKLIDPTWGGVYQYSTMGDWDYAHFEKLGFLQGEYMRTYALAYDHFKDPKYLRAAKDIESYVRHFLTDSGGAFYSTQDADVVAGKHSSEYFSLNDEGRRKIGIPRIDKHIYSSVNGRIISGLISLYESTNEKEYLDRALRAANWIEANRAINGNLVDTVKWVFKSEDTKEALKKLKWVVVHFSFHEAGYRHDEKDAAGPFLCDNLNMGVALLDLYRATGNKKWLIKATQIGRFIDRNFYAPLPGVITAAQSCEVCASSSPTKRLDENILNVRFASKLYGLTKEDLFKDLAANSMRYLATPVIASQSLTEPGILIAEKEYLDSL